MKMRSNKTILGIFVVMSVLSASYAMAVGNISATKHNFSSGAGSASLTFNTESQVCVFCHTPHNAGQSRLLWNKANLSSAITYRLYTSSSTLTSATRSASLTADSPSLLCLGCHDGKTAMNVLHASSASGTTDAGASYPAGSKLMTANGALLEVKMPATGLWNPLLEAYDPTFALGTSQGATAGDNLTDDHPIGFSYSAAYAQETSGGLNNYVGMDSSIRFYGPTKKVECTTCHDPHTDTFARFLVKSNDGSALCLTCHNK